MRFIVSGRVRLTGGADDGSEIPIGTLDEGGYFGQSTLTRQPVIGNAQAVDEVTVVQDDRGHIEMLVQRNPLLLQEFGRTIEERRANARRALTATVD